MLSVVDEESVDEAEIAEKRADLRYIPIENFVISSSLDCLILKFPFIVASKLPAGLQKSVNFPEVTEQVWVFAWLTQ